MNTKAGETRDSHIAVTKRILARRALSCGYRVYVYYDVRCLRVSACLLVPKKKCSLLLMARCLFCNSVQSTIGCSRQGRGGVVVSLPLGEPGSIPGEVIPGFSHLRIVPVCFLGDLPLPRSFVPALLHTHLAPPSSALKTSLLRAVQIPPLHFTKCTQDKEILILAEGLSGHQHIANPTNPITLRLPPFISARGYFQSCAVPRRIHPGDVAIPNIRLPGRLLKHSCLEQPLGPALPHRLPGWYNLLLTLHFLFRDPGSIPGRVTPDFRMWESCRTMPLVGGSSRGSPLSPAISQGKREIPEKTRRPAASSGTIPTCENPGAIPPEIEPGSPRLRRNGVAVLSIWVYPFDELERAWWLIGYCALRNVPHRLGYWLTSELSSADWRTVFFPACCWLKAVHDKVCTFEINLRKKHPSSIARPIAAFSTSEHHSPAFPHPLRLQPPPPPQFPMSLHPRTRLFDLVFRSMDWKASQQGSHLTAGIVNGFRTSTALIVTRRGSQRWNVVPAIVEQTMMMEASIEQRRNERAAETGDPRENPPTNGIVRHDFHIRKCVCSSHAVAHLIHPRDAVVGVQTSSREDRGSEPGPVILISAVHRFMNVGVVPYYRPWLIPRGLQNLRHYFTSG
ncbi:hypothetical protein PR048_006362 [Dryococelus australis]|uniref:Uncharacterized protein n=1 Tax=Dryococelus australis TaxID=614101 RepID=A0ABQ9IAS1_9NEOP|nr:hypothetical protein PR048_006362 [Dryococelus australis]